MTKQEYIDLYEKYLSGNCSEEEKLCLYEYDANFDLSAADEEWPAEFQFVHDRLSSKLKASIAETKKGELRRTNNWLKYAAAVLLLMTTGLIFYINQGKKTDASDNPQKIVKNDILPGKSKAILTLPDGRKLELDSLPKGHLDDLTMQQIVKGSKAITFAGSIGQSLPNQVEYNTITTPRGGDYLVVLPDNTKVWLNAVSSLKFPTAFTTNERRVELTGEGYFEVAKNPQTPFLVTANGVEVKVLGTHFNIMAYADEPAIKTTLLEGSVKLISNRQETRLVPGEQGIVKPGVTGIAVKVVDTDDEVAWKNDYFIFNNEKLGSAMKRVARWYNVEVEFRNGVENRKIGGAISKYKTISELLDNMSLTSVFHYKIEGRRVILTT